MEAFFDLNHNDRQNRNSNKEYKITLMTVPIGVLVVVNDYFDGLYVQVWVRPLVSVSLYVCVSVYDPFLHCYIHRKLQLALLICI